jgi:hypothetical protein
MPVPFRCGVTLPLWAVASCAAALSAPQRVRPFLVTFVALGVIASTMPPILRRFGRLRKGAVVTAGGRSGSLHAATRPLTGDDALDLVRMDDDGGWQMARQSALARGPVARKNQRLL